MSNMDTIFSIAWLILIGISAYEQAITLAETFICLIALFGISTICRTIKSNPKEK